MAYSKSNDVMCPVFLLGTDYIMSLHFQNRKNCLEMGL